ncbi:MAG: acyl-CoA thioesterase [Alphaproteobacteria bacterium]|jgi:4-hydroxybenzoyl-CoA thioesterase|nr:acyl-CoA thioesterase [Alphaproteobacteria bacterium]
MYQFHQKVLFKHCDPAGIVFFPRYYEMVNDCVEAFFADVLDWPFEAMHQTGAVPTRAIESEFLTPARHGDALVLDLRITGLGRTSCSYSITARCGDETRFTHRATLVNVSANGRPAAWPAPVATKLEEVKDPT